MTKWADQRKKEVKFLHRYKENGFNGAEAARYVGYADHVAKKMAYKILKKDRIKRVLGKVVKQAEHELSITTGWKLERLKACVDAAMEGRASQHGIVNVPGAVSAIAEMNKMQGDYAPVKQLIATIDTDPDKKIARELVDEYTKEF